MARFDYVSYDEKSKAVSADMKDRFEEIEKAIEEAFPKSTREKQLALTSLETTYMWIGKAIKADQEKRNLEEAPF